MPKKRNQSYFSKPPTSAHPSISSHEHDSHRDAESDKSVNDLLQQLRIDQALAVASTEPRPDTNPQTVHPSLKHILQIPETPPLRPRPGTRAMATHGRRRPPGPPPPRSWLSNNVHTPVRSAPKHSSALQQRPCLERLRSFPNLGFPCVKSLQHQALVAIAKNWDFHVHYDQYYLPLLPTRYKPLLLTYIAAYSPNGISAQGLSILLADDSIIKGATGTEGLTHLDLSVSIGRSISLKDLKQLITTTFPTPTITDSTPDSWDLPASLSPAPTCTLTHLSLAYPPPSISWRHLLQLSPHLNTLTHLSLSHWPAPTLTPNSTTAYLSTPHGNISYGDHNLYSASLDNDFSGPANVLRLLSRDTYCLQWLDLSSCSFWLTALSWRDDGGTGADWAGPWSGLTTVVVAQDWIPECLRSPDAEPHWKVVLKSRDDDVKRMRKLKRELITWIETELHNEAVLKRIRDGRLVEKSAKTAEWGVLPDEYLPLGPPSPSPWSRANVDGIPPKEESARRSMNFDKGWEGWWIEDCIREYLNSITQVTFRWPE
ncbi:MAG: hypothetical protein Q9221_007087 [Calogaya cf. arnoldii]